MAKRVNWVALQGEGLRDNTAAHFVRLYKSATCRMLPTTRAPLDNPCTACGDEISGGEEFRPYQGRDYRHPLHEECYQDAVDRTRLAALLPSQQQQEQPLDEESGEDLLSQALADVASNYVIDKLAPGQQADILALRLELSELRGRIAGLEYAIQHFTKGAK